MSSPSRLDPVHAQVARLAGGRRKTRFVTVLGRALFIAAAVLAVQVWFVTTATVVTTAVILFGSAVLVAIVAAWLFEIDAVAVAKRYDDAVGTKDLLSTSLQLEVGEDEGLSGAFVTAVQEDAAQATGRAGSEDLYPTQMPRELRWMPLPLAVVALALLIPLLSMIDPPGPTEAERNAILAGAKRLDQLVENRTDDQVSDLQVEGLAKVKNLAELLRRDEVGKRDALSELARLASQLDKERKELESRKMEVEKNAAKLARGEDAQDVRRDMDAGKYREAANKVKKKLAKLKKKLKEAIEKKAGKMEIDKLRKRIAKLKNLLAMLEELEGLGNNLGFLLEVQDVLDRIEGELGELGEFDGDVFDEVQLGRGRPAKPKEFGEQGGKLFAMPSEQAGEGHAKKFLGKGKRSLTEGDDHEARLREGKGKSQFGQVKTANDGSRSRKAYDKAFLAAKRAADDAIYRQNIPAGYRTYIRRYFETMQPDDREARKK